METSNSFRPPFRSVNRRKGELKRLDCSANYDSYGDQCSRVEKKAKIGVLSFLYEANDFDMECERFE
jgi:hypothetical protein